MVCKGPFPVLDNEGGDDLAVRTSVGAARLQSVGSKSGSKAARGVRRASHVTNEAEKFCARESGQQKVVSADFHTADLPVTVPAGAPPTDVPFPLVPAESSDGSLLPCASELPHRPDTASRRFSCRHYNECLALAAALDWSNFSCTGCCGEVNDALVWRAHHARKRDAMVKILCHLPKIPLFKIVPGS
jgi:hypothetical protein